MTKEILSELPLGDIAPNLARMFGRNCTRLKNQNAFAQRENGSYVFYSWSRLGQDIGTFCNYLLDLSLNQGDRVGLITQNSYYRLVAEMAVMINGMVAVPIFVGYNHELLSTLLEFSETKLLIIESEELLAGLKAESVPGEVVLIQSEEQQNKKQSHKKIPAIKELLPAKRSEDFLLSDLPPSSYHIKPESLALIMYTSGTTNFPKGVMLTHYNILSQQGALAMLWNPKPGLRFLCYLPWHHSFGGLFERFFALCSGGCIAIDDSRGKDIKQLFQNFKEIKPHIYFSVPKVYHEIVSKTITSEDADKTFFHDQLKFIFTAAAPLTASISDHFKLKKIPVVEGWGLTETSPCCTLTKLSLERTPGIVGFPIPGVQIKLSKSGEILAKGTNIMLGYFKNEKATKKVFSKDGWFKTGDIGEITDQGIRIVSRKDRMFKLNNGEKIFPSILEERIKEQCIYIKNIFIFGGGQDQPLALIFPNFELLTAQKIHEAEGFNCKYPKSSESFAGCLKDCLIQINQKIKSKIEWIKNAVLIEADLSLELGELTPSMKLVPRVVEKNYKIQIQCLEEDNFKKLPKNSFVIQCEQKIKKKKTK